MRELRINITADGSQAKRELGDVEKSTKSVATAATDVDKSFATMGINIAQAVGVVSAAWAASDILTKVGALTTAFAEQETALTKLQTALTAQGQGAPAVMKQYEDLANTFQKTTGFTDELIVEMEALLVQVGNVMPAQMEAALTAATNLSAGLGVDLRTATMLVGKAFEGETGTLKRYGIVIDDTKLKGEGVSAVLEAINAKFGGQAQAQMETFTGKQKALSIALGEVQERMGELITKAIIPLIDLFLGLPEPVQMVLLGAAALTPVIVSLGIAIAGITAALPLLGAAFTAILPFLGPVGLIAAGVTAIYVAWKYWDEIVAFFQGAWQFVVQSLTSVPDLLLPLLGPIGLVVVAFKHWDEIAAIAQAVYTGVKEWLVDKFAAVVQWIGEKVGQVTGFFKDMYDKVVGNSYVPDMMKGIEEEFKKLPEIMIAPTGSATLAVEDMFGRMADGVTGKISDWTSGLRKSLVGFMGGPGSLLGGILQSGLGALLGPAGPLSGLISAGIQKLGELAIAGAKKIWEGIQNVFGNDEEAREVNPRRDTFLSQWGDPSNKGVGGAGHNLASILTELGAGDGGGSLFSALQRADKMNEFRPAAQAIVDFLTANGRSASMNFAVGGMVPRDGLAMVHRNEAVLTPRGVAAVGGPEGVHALNRGSENQDVVGAISALRQDFASLAMQLQQQSEQLPRLAAQEAMLARGRQLAHV
jgi:hypothetical protein